MERKWQMTRIAKGDYLLPSNDRATLWRIYSYEEDGSAEWYGGMKVLGTFWACAKYDRPHWELGAEQDPDFFEWGDHWLTWDTTLRTRTEAIQAALRAGEKVAAMREP